MRENYLTLHLLETRARRTLQNGINETGNINEWSNKTAEITGLSKDKALSKPIFSTSIAPSLQALAQEILDNILHSYETSNSELEFEAPFDKTIIKIVEMQIIWLQECEDERQIQFLRTIVLQTALTSTECS